MHLASCIFCIPFCIVDFAVMHFTHYILRANLLKKLIYEQKESWLVAHLAEHTNFPLHAVMACYFLNGVDVSKVSVILG